MLAVAALDDRQASESARALVARHPGEDELELYASGGHGTNLFRPRPELKPRIVTFARQAVGLTTAP
jgi:hypothetical protein